jgi:hypothetical protein|tara:strand:- start:684 stop:872 length:189 start_codon:yes stop_codon:yes gene_type:complete
MKMSRKERQDRRGRNRRESEWRGVKRQERIELDRIGGELTGKDRQEWDGKDKHSILWKGGEH